MLDPMHYPTYPITRGELRDLIEDVIRRLQKQKPLPSTFDPNAFRRVANTSREIAFGLNRLPAKDKQVGCLTLQAYKTGQAGYGAGTFDLVVVHKLNLPYPSAGILKVTN